MGLTTAKASDWCTQMISQLPELSGKVPKGESNGSGLNRSSVNDLIDHQSIGYTVKAFEGVEGALHSDLHMKMNFVC